MELLTKGLEFTPRKKKLVILFAIFGFSTYGVYKVYNLPSVSRKRKRLIKLLASLIAITEALSNSSKILGTVSKDLEGFLTSDQDQIPNSLIQLSKITSSEDFSDSLTRVSEAAILGVIQGYQEEQKAENSSSSSFKDRVMDKLMSKSGTGFVSVVVGSFARNLVLGFDSDGSYELVDVLSDNKVKVVVGDLIKTFVSTAVAVYLDRQTSTSDYDDAFSGMIDPKYEKHVKDIVVYVCSGAVETFVKTSEQVLTS